MKIHISDIENLYTECNSEKFIAYIFKTTQNQYISIMRYNNAIIIYTDNFSIEMPYYSIVVLSGKVKIGDVTIDFPNCKAIADVENAFREIANWKGC